VLRHLLEHVVAELKGQLPIWFQIHQGLVTGKDPYTCERKVTPRPPGAGLFEMSLTDREKHLLERLGTAGKAVELRSGEIETARQLEVVDLVFLVPDGSSRAVITPKGRRLLAGEEVAAQKTKKKPPSLE